MPGELPTGAVVRTISPRSGFRLSPAASHSATVNSKAGSIQPSASVAVPGGGVVEYTVGGCPQLRRTRSARLITGGTSIALISFSGDAERVAYSFLHRRLQGLPFQARLERQQPCHFLARAAASGPGLLARHPQDQTGCAAAASRRSPMRTLSRVSWAVWSKPRPELTLRGHPSSRWGRLQEEGIVVREAARLLPHGEDAAAISSAQRAKNGASCGQRLTTRPFRPGPPPRPG